MFYYLNLEHLSIARLQQALQMFLKNQNYHLFLMYQNFLMSRQYLMFR
jgi:hypothetical protein